MKCQQNLVTAVIEYTRQTKNPTLTGFLKNRVPPDNDDKESADNNDVVTLITLHSAKGLEFPIVFMAGVEKRLLPHHKSNLEDERRLCYVGMTRAQEQLYLTYADARGIRFNLRSRFIDEIPSKYLREERPHQTPKKVEIPDEYIAHDDHESNTTIPNPFKEPDLENLSDLQKEIIQEIQAYLEGEDTLPEDSSPEPIDGLGKDIESEERHPNYDFTGYDFTESIINPQPAKKMSASSNLNSASDYLNHGHTYRREGDYDLAIANYTKAIELEPNDVAYSYYGRGQAYYEKRDYTNAISDFTKIIELEPDNANAYNNRGHAYRRRGRKDDRARAKDDRAKARMLRKDGASPSKAENIAMFQNSGNRYTYNESLQRLFEDLVKQPFENHPPTRAWEVEVRKTNHTYHREVILDRGRTNFDESFNDLSPEDKTLIYCVYYMPMHLVSSYHIFRVHNQAFTSLFTSVSNKAVFIDFGCGPLTSGIAFWAFARKLNIIYLGVESSQAMRNKAKEINQYGPNQYRNPFFSRFETISNYNQLTELLDRSITKGDKTPIVFNFCYFLASRTLDIGTLSDVIIQIVEKYSNHNMYIVCQNPDAPGLNKNWEALKANLAGFRSRITQSHVEQFCYNMLIDGSPRYANVYYDLLCNK